MAMGSQLKQWLGLKDNKVKRSKKKNAAGKIADDTPKTKKQVIVRGDKDD